MEQLSFNYGDEHFSRLDRWSNDELNTLSRRLTEEAIAGDIIRLAIDGIMAERSGVFQQHLDFTLSNSTESE